MDVLGNNWRDLRFLEECPAQRVLALVRGGDQGKVVKAAVCGERILGHEVEGCVWECDVYFAGVRRVSERECHARVVGLELLVESVVDQVALRLIIEFEPECGFEILAYGAREVDPWCGRVQVGGYGGGHERCVIAVFDIAYRGDVYA